MKINDIVKIEGATVANVISEEKWAQIILEGGSSEYPKLVPIKFFGKAFQALSLPAIGSVVDVEIYLSGSEYNGKYYSDFQGKSCTIVKGGNTERKASKTDSYWLTLIEDCRNIGELTGLWARMSPEEKKAHLAAKDAKKKDLEQAARKPAAASDDLPF